MRKGRPYPPDADRRRRVRIELARRDLTLADLSEAIQVQKSHLSEIINGIRLSPKTESRIAAFLDVPVEALFPVRTLDEMEALRGRCA